MKNKQFMKMYLQKFTDDYVAEGNIRKYEKKFTQLQKAIFGKLGYFRDFLASGTIDAIDGITNKSIAFSVKATKIPMVIAEGVIGGSTAYNTGANVAFGTGTGSTNRFGARTEVVYEDIDVPYTWDWCFHEGIDVNTVNESFDAAVQDRLEMQGQQKTAMISKHIGSYISASAAKAVACADPTTQTNAKKVFSDASKYFKNIGLIPGVRKVAKVNADLYDALCDADLLTTAKNANINIAEGVVEMFKGFEVECLPDDMFEADEYAYFYVTGIGAAFVGIEVARTIDSEQFAGKALQGCGKGGEWCPEANKKAIFKVCKTVAG